MSEQSIERKHTVQVSEVSEVRNKTVLTRDVPPPPPPKKKKKTPENFENKEKKRGTAIVITLVIDLKAILTSRSHRAIGHEFDHQR